MLINHNTAISPIQQRIHITMASFTDDYVASILQRDADKKSTSNLSSLFSTVGGKSRPRSSAPKANARFLKNLVRDVDSHNTALKEKEERESRRRMWDLQRGKKGERPERPKKKVEDDDDEERSSKRRRRSLERYAPGSGKHKRARSRSRSPDRERKHPHHHRSSEHRRRHRSTEREREKSRSRSPDASRRSRDKRRHKNTDRERERSKSRSRSRSPERRHRRRPEPDEPDSSEDEIGPDLPARGRGSQHASILDQKEDEYTTVPRPAVGDEADIANVKWTAKGQEREWDRGKDKDPFNMKEISEEPEEDWTGRLKDM